MAAEGEVTDNHGGKLSADTNTRLDSSSKGRPAENPKQYLMGPAGGLCKTRHNNHNNEGRNGACVHMMNHRFLGVMCKHQSAARRNFQLREQQVDAADSLS